MTSDSSSWPSDDHEEKSDFTPSTDPVRLNARAHVLCVGMASPSSPTPELVGASDGMKSMNLTRSIPTEARNFTSWYICFDAHASPCRSLPADYYQLKKSQRCAMRWTPQCRPSNSVETQAVVSRDPGIEIQWSV